MGRFINDDVTPWRHGFDRLAQNKDFGGWRSLDVAAEGAGV